MAKKDNRTPIAADKNILIKSMDKIIHKSNIIVMLIKIIQLFQEVTFRPIPLIK